MSSLITRKAMFNKASNSISLLSGTDIEYNLLGTKSEVFSFNTLKEIYNDRRT